MGTKRIGAAAIAVLTGTIGIAAPASADAIQQPLSIKSVGDVVVDGVHDRVFISDPTSGTVVATDYSGNPLGTAQVAAAASLVLTADSSQLYVTSPAEAAVFALDTSTLAQTAKYSTGAVKPYDVTVAGNRIWFSYGSPSRLGTIDPSTETPTVLLDMYDTKLGAAQLATASAAPNRIGVASYGKLAVLEVSGDTVTEVAVRDSGAEFLDMAISPDGEQLATAFQGGYGIRLQDVSDLTTSRLLQFPFGFSNAVDYAADGTVVGGSFDAFDPNLHVFDRPSGQRIRSIEPPNGGRGLDRNVAWEPDGDRLFAVSANGSKLVFNAYTDAKLSPTDLTYWAPPTSLPGAQVTITGSLTSSLSLPTGTSVTISRNGTPVGTTEVGSGGKFTLTDTPLTEGPTTYQISYAGDDRHLPSAKTFSVLVAKAESTVTFFGPSTAIPGQSITIPARLTSQGAPCDETSVTVSRNGTPLGASTVDSNCDFSFTDTPPGEGSWTYQVSYAGDDIRLPITRTTTVVVSRTASTLTLAGPASATRAKALTITGKLASPLALTAGSKVSVSRFDLDYPSGRSLGTKTVAANGTFSIVDTPTAGGTVTYRASFAGDLTHTPASASKAVAVSRTAPALAINNNGKIYAYGQTVSFTAKLGTTYKNRVVEIWADPAGSDQARRLIKRATVSKTGYVSASVKLTRNTTVSAVFTGDARTAPRTVYTNVGAKAYLKLHLSRHYKTAKIGSLTYRFYRTNSVAWFTNAMNSGSQRLVYVQVQRYTNGKWKNWDGRYFDATDILFLPGTGLKGVKFRIRTAYVKGSSGDSLNSTTWTPYQYFTFTK
jgi:WD40 repeat protein